jgi:hypothetical protein
MNIIDAAHGTVHDYPGGSESLGPRVDISAAVLRNKVNPNNSTHHLTLAEAVRIADLAADYRMLKAWAHEAGFLLVKAPKNARDSSDMAVLEQVAGLMVANGAFGKEIYDALSDGAVSTAEVERIDQAGQGVMTSVAEIKQRIRGMAQ